MREGPFYKPCSKPSESLAIQTYGDAQTVMIVLNLKCVRSIRHRHGESDWIF